MKIDAYALLRAITAFYPLGEGKHHNLIATTEGLHLSVLHGDLWHDFTLEEADGDKDPQVLAQEIHDMLESHVAAEAVEGATP